MVNTVILGALCVLGLYAAMGEGMVLQWLRDFFERITDNRVLRYIRPALYECPVCMASIWGSVAWLILGNKFTIVWVLYVFAVAGLNYVILNLISDDE